MPNPSQEPPTSFKAPNKDLKDIDVLYTFKIQKESQNMDVSKTSDYIQIKIKVKNTSQEPSASSRAPNEDLKDMDILCIFKIKKESQNLEHWCIIYLWP